MNVKVYNQFGKEVGEMELPKVFDLPWNADLVHQVVTSQAANLRRPIAHAKNRGEVRGGGKKPWRQKGTGRARHGSIRSPIWVGGGVTHGPTKERNFKRKVAKKMAARALATVLAAKIRDKQLLVLDDLSFTQPKTKEAAKVFSNLAKIKAFSDITAKRNRSLLLLDMSDRGVRRAMNNLPFVGMERAENVTALGAMNRKYIILPRSAVAALEKRFR